MTRHHKTNYHYFHVIGDCPSFIDIHKSYQNLAAKNPYITTISLNALRQRINRTGGTDQHLLNDPNNVFILWQDDTIATSRKCKVIIRYSEMVNDIANTGHQKELLLNFQNNMNSYDLILVHSKSAEKHLKRLTDKVSYLPIGYDEQVYGKPDYTSPKEHDLAYFGSYVGRRIKIVEYLKNHFGDRFHDLPCWDDGRRDILNKSKINLIIPWCKDPSFAAFRMLHTIGTSAAMLTEKADTYPAKNDKHIIQITDFDDENTTIKEIEHALTLDLQSIARRAHDDLSKITVDVSMEQLIELSKTLF